MSCVADCNTCKAFKGADPALISRFCLSLILFRACYTLETILLTQCLKDTGAAANACFVEFFCSRIFIRFVSVPFQILDFPVPIRNCGCYFFPTSKMLSCSGKYFLPR